MKCPQCGKEMSPDDILIPVSDREGNIIDCFHVPFRTWKKFVTTCGMQEVKPSEMLKELMKEFIESEKEKK